MRSFYTHAMPTTITNQLSPRLHLLKAMDNPHNTFRKGLDTRAVNGGCDEYFTAPSVAEDCLSKLLPLLRRWRISNPLFLEPSAGSGAWLDALSPKASYAAYDIKPQDSRIKKADFFDLPVSANCIVIGNPPFGFAAKDAIRFFNHAATNAAVIAFIVPCTFKKASIQAKLHLNYHLEHQSDLPSYSFTVNGVPHDVPCCFQVWRRKAKQRVQCLQPIKNQYFDFTGPGRADFAVRRVGGRAGKLLPGLNHSESSTYFIKAKGCPLKLKAVIASINFDVVNHTAGVRSLSKRELVAAVCAAMEAFQ